MTTGPLRSSEEGTLAGKLWWASITYCCVRLEVDLAIQHITKLSDIEHTLLEKQHLHSIKMPPVSDQNGTSHTWISLPQAMSKAVDSLDKILNNDAQWQAFVDTKAIIEPVTMGVQSTGGDEAILVSVSPDAKTSSSTGSSDKADFTLRAQPQQWEKFFAADPVAPYTSFVGLQV